MNNPNHPISKAEPFKRWLAKVGYERVQEIEDPELGTKEPECYIKQKAIRTDGLRSACAGLKCVKLLLTSGKNGESRKARNTHFNSGDSQSHFRHDSEPAQKYRILNAKICARSHDRFGAIFSMLGEAATTEIAKNRCARFSAEQKSRATRRGSCGKARRDVEQKSGKKVVSRENFWGWKKKS